MTARPPTSAADVVPLLAMGCRWSLDLGGMPEGEVAVMRDRWSRCATLATAPDALVLDPEVELIQVVSADDQPLSDQTAEGVRVALHDATQLPYDLSRAITRRGIHRLRGTGPLLLHAASVSEGDRAVVLVARSGGGKSTAARRLSRSFGYVTDESVVITADGDIAPYPKPPSIIVDPARPGDKDEPPPDEVGMNATPATVRLATLLGLRRDPETATPQIVEVDLAEHLLDLIPETSSLWLVEQGLDRLARAATTGGPPAQLRYAEIDECVDLLREHIAEAAPVEPWWVHLPPPAEEAWRDAVPPRPDDDLLGEDLGIGSSVVRAPWSDALDDNGVLVILQGSAVYAIEATVRAVWLVLGEPLTVREVVDAVVALQGPHPDAEDLVLQAVRVLVEQGLVHPFAVSPTPTVGQGHRAEGRHRLRGS